MYSIENDQYADRAWWLKAIVGNSILSMGSLNLEYCNELKHIEFLNLESAKSIRLGENNNATYNFPSLATIADNLTIYCDGYGVLKWCGIENDHVQNIA